MCRHDLIKKTPWTPAKELKPERVASRSAIVLAEKNLHAESTPESLLQEDGTHKGMQRPAIKSVLAYKLDGVRRTRTVPGRGWRSARRPVARSSTASQSGNEGVTLHTLKRAVAAVGMRIELEFR